MDNIQIIIHNQVGLPQANLPMQFINPNNEKQGEIFVIVPTQLLMGPSAGGGSLTFCTLWLNLLSELGAV